MNTYTDTATGTDYRAKTVNNAAKRIWGRGVQAKQEHSTARTAEWVSYIVIDKNGMIVGNLYTTDTEPTVSN